MTTETPETRERGAGNDRATIRLLMLAPVLVGLAFWTGGTAAGLWALLAWFFGGVYGYHVGAYDKNGRRKL